MNFRHLDASAGKTELWLLEPQHSEALFRLVDANRQHLRRWHPWADRITAVSAAEMLIAAGLTQFAQRRGFCAGIWFEGQLCGAINHVAVDWANRATALSYWLDEAHQGRGIMTAACRICTRHAFESWKLNRVGIECGAENTRSRAVAERLGFRFEGIVRGAELLHGRYVDHALYSLLRVDFTPEPAGNSAGSREHCGSGISNHPPGLFLDASAGIGSFRIQA